MPEAFGDVLVLTRQAAEGRRGLFTPPTRPRLGFRLELDPAVARSKATDFRIAHVVTEMDRLKEHREDDGYDDCRPTDAHRRAAPEHAREMDGRAQTDAEQQPARDGHSVQYDIAHFTDPGRNEPLQPFVDGADEEGGQRRQHEHRGIVDWAPRAIEQQREDAIFDEVERFHDV